uniref:Synergin gamma C-terminal domain-containing protein n=1 Tax=Chenopodium quinoa TaxID=63459 RepID=A0A803KP81_CHEQI
MAEHDEDGFSFGDFKFTPPPPPSHLQPQPQINGVTSTSKIADVWGDFFFNPSPPPSTPSQSQFNLPDNNGFSSSFNWAQPVSGPSPIRVDPGPNKPPKPSIGALPLSLIGEVDPNPNVQSNGSFDLNGFNMNFNGVASDLSIENGNKKNGQDAFKSVDPKLGVNGFGPQSIDFFAALYENGANHQSSEMDVSIKSSTSTTNGFMWDPFPEAELIGNGGGLNASSMNQDDDSDDFGDFVDASQEVVSKEKQEQVGDRMDPAEAQLPNGEAQEKQTQTKPSRGALPLSLFCDDTEESSDPLNLQNEVAPMPTLTPANSFSGQKPVISIKDLVSNLYSQAQLTSSVDSTVKPAENGVQSPLNVAVTTSFEEDDDWDDDSWEFKGAYSDNGVGEQLSPAIPGYIAQKQLPELRIYMDFYDQLRGSLCFLLSCQLDDLKKARSSDVVNGNGGKAEALDDEMQEVSKLLEESVTSKEVLSKKDLERSSCLNKFLEILQGPKFNVIEAEFSLSKRLQLAANEWKVAAELLRHAISMLKILSLGTADEQSLYVTTWSKIINVCVQELSHGASIWKRASEKNVQHQILLNSRGQKFIQALGEIFKVVELLGVSAKVYKPWILLSVSDSSQFFSVLFECGALWVNSGLEGALQNLSDDIDFQCNETAKPIVASITNICEIDVVAVHDLVFRGHKTTCQMSLLPQEILTDLKTLKTVTWGGKPYFLNLANLWANLISSNPPQLPNLQVS